MSTRVYSTPFRGKARIQVSRYSLHKDADLGDILTQRDIGDSWNEPGCGEMETVDAKNSPGQRRWEQAIAQGKGGIFDDLTHQCAQQDGREDTTEQTNPCSVRQ